MTIILQRGIYEAARQLNKNIGTPATAWVIDGGDTTATGFALMGRLGSQPQPGAYDVAGPAQPFNWYFVTTARTLTVGQQLSYGGNTFSVAALADPMLIAYELKLVELA